MNCPACGEQMSTDSNAGGLSYFCANPHCEEYDEFLNGISREELLEQEESDE